MRNDRTDPTQPPSRELLLLEVRALWELAAFVASYPMLRLAPRGDGHPVLVLPGWLASDSSTQPLRWFLRRRGYHAHGWRLGRNHGPTAEIVGGMAERLTQLRARHGRPVSLVGWSLGGIYARELARRRPEDVRQVITLGSPFSGAPRASNAWRLYERVSERKVEDWEGRERMKTPPPVPSTAIYSRTDGIVAWQGCLERHGPTSENIEVAGSHCGLGHNPQALFALADRLAQAEGDWRPFERLGVRAMLFRDPARHGDLPVGAASAAAEA